jgi:hypothetical protein
MEKCVVRIVLHVVIESMATYSAYYGIRMRKEGTQFLKLEQSFQSNLCMLHEDTRDFRKSRMALVENAWCIIGARELPYRIISDIPRRHSMMYHVARHVSCASKEHRTEHRTEQEAQNVKQQHVGIPVVMVEVCLKYWPGA